MYMLFFAVFPSCVAGVRGALSWSPWLHETRKVGREIFKLPLSGDCRTYILFFILSFLCRRCERGPLLESLVTVARKVGREIFKSPLSAKASHAERDTLAKSLYFQALRLVRASTFLDNGPGKRRDQKRKKVKIHENPAWRLLKAAFDHVPASRHMLRSP